MDRLPFDLSVLGIDPTKVLAINGITMWVKDQLAELKMPEWASRFYVALPFAVAFVLAVSDSAMELLPAITEAVKYGAAAMVLKNVYRVSVEGK